MSTYANVVKLMKEVKSVTSFITALGKIRAKTEDTKLTQLLDEVIGALSALRTSMKSNKSAPICLEKADNPKVIALKTYCENFIKNKKPEWQVLAERNGWGPLKK